MPAGVGIRSTLGAGEEAYVQKPAATGDVLLSDQPFAVLSAPLPQLPEQTGAGEGSDLQQVLRKLAALRQSLKELCATIVSFQPDEPKKYWDAIGCMSCPSTDMPHPVLKEVMEVCGFLSQQGQALGLFKLWPDASKLAVGRTVLTWMTNCLPYKGKSALFPLASKVNHSCRPNARWDPELGSFIATRAIDAGEGISMAYIRASDEAAFARCSYLYQQFFFWCQCSACESERRWSAAASSGARHAELRAAQALLEGGLDRSRAKPLLKIAKTAGLAPGHFVISELCRFLGEEVAAPSPQGEPCAAVPPETGSNEKNRAKNSLEQLPESAAKSVDLEALD